MGATATPMSTISRAAYRDSRINRIFEGTNEINRLLTLDMYLKRAMKGRINLMAPCNERVSKELMAIPDFSGDDTPFAAENKAIENFKKAILDVRRRCGAEADDEDRGGAGNTHEPRGHGHENF